MFRLDLSIRTTTNNRWDQSLIYFPFIYSQCWWLFFFSSPDHPLFCIFFLISLYFYYFFSSLSQWNVRNFSSFVLPFLCFLKKIRGTKTRNGKHTNSMTNPGRFKDPSHNIWLTRMLIQYTDRTKTNLKFNWEGYKMKFTRLGKKSIRELLKIYQGMT